MIKQKIRAGLIALFRYAVWHIKETSEFIRLNPERGAIDDFGINFAKRTLRKYYEQAITPAVTNRDYEGEIKSFGDRLRILSFLHDIAVDDYTVSTDMSVQTIYDNSEELVIEKKKYYDFSIDKVEQIFTYSSDVADALVSNASKELEKIVDNYVLGVMGNGVRAGNWLGQNVRVVASSADTHCSIVTTTGSNVLSLQMAGTLAGTDGTTVEAPDGTLFFAGFTSADAGKGVRLTSGATWATEWYRISSVTNTNSCVLVNWDDSTEGYPIPNGDVLRGMYGGKDFTSDTNGDGKPTSMAGWGWEFQAAIPTTVTTSNIWDHMTMLDEMLNKDLNPIEDRHIILPFSGKTMLLQASELQPSGIEMLYTDTIVNGRVGRVAGFDVHVTSQGRFSTKVGHSYSTLADASTVVTTGTTGYLFPAFHKSFCTFAFKWSESRTVDMEKQFGKAYQGLQLFGAKVPTLRKSAGAVLYAQAI